MQAPAAAKLLHRLAVDDTEVQAELVAHLLAPLNLQAGGAHDEHRPDTVAQHQLLDDQATLDGLAQAHVVCDKQIDPWHLDGTGQRVELVVLDFDTRAEWSLQGAGIGLRNGAPAHGVQERIQL